MNKCSLINNKINEVKNIIDNSGISASEFLDELMNMYNTNNSSIKKTDILIDYNSYYDSFVE